MKHVITTLSELLTGAMVIALVGAALLLLAGCSTPQTTSWEPHDYLPRSKERLCGSVYAELMDCSRPLPELALTKPVPYPKGEGLRWQPVARYIYPTQTIEVSDPSHCATGRDILPWIYDCTWEYQDAVDHEMAHHLLAGLHSRDEEEYWARRVSRYFQKGY